MFHYLPNSARADWNLAEVAVQLCKMVEHQNQSQPNPGLRADESLCSTLRVWLREALPGYEVHDCGLAGGEAEGGEGDVAVQKAALVDQPQDLGRRHTLVRPI